jgi:SAM-dependent methyltransferase
MSLQKGIAHGLICVTCKNSVNYSPNDQEIKCLVCNSCYPSIGSIPIMINEKESIFDIKDFTDSRSLFFDISKKGKWINAVTRFLPSIGGNMLGEKNFDFLENLLVRLNAEGKPRILVVGGSIVGEGMNSFVHSERLSLIEGDVSFGPRTQIVFDAHTIPYADSSFDCVVVQAVLEHVIHPHQCVAEIYRVLKPSGVIYAETPFMQQVHGGPYDFTRYTRSGHRKLFYKFEEIKSGTTAGSGTALAWNYQYFLLSLFGHSNVLRLGVKVFARLTGFWIKYFDYLTRFNERDSDAASGFYFMGKKTDGIAISDRDLIKYYSVRK